MAATVTAVFHEAWFGDTSCDALADLCARTADLDGDVVEVGSWEGRSTIALANAAWPATVHAVDTWQGSPGEVSETLAAQRDVYATFKANVAACTKGNITPHRVDWHTYFTLRRDPVRFLFIDAAHTYEEVRDNIAAALPLLVPGGIICGDDVHHPPVQEAVLEAFPDAQRAVTLWWWQKPATLADQYERACQIPSDIYQHLPRLARLVTDRNAAHVIELGSRTGVSTVAWLYALEKTGGWLTSVDLDPRPEIGNWPHWRSFQANDLDPDLLGRLDEADIVFIDTSHHYQQTLSELRIYRWLVRRPGLMVLHDTELAHPEGMPHSDPRYPVRAAIEEFCADEGFEWTNHPECFGLGVIEVG